MDGPDGNAQLAEQQVLPRGIATDRWRHSREPARDGGLLLCTTARYIGREMPGRVRIEGLAEELTLDDAVEVAYGDELAAVEQKLRHGLSVLIECDKQIVLYLYRNLR